MSTTLLKNVASQRVRVYAYTPADGLPKTGDAANITVYIAKDYGAVTALTDTSATEEDATNAPGYYWCDITQAETNADNILVTGKSATAGVKVLGAPAVIGTRPATGFLAPATAGRTVVVDASGLVDANAVKVGPTGSGTAQTARDLGAQLDAAVSTRATPAQVATALTDIHLDHLFAVADPGSVVADSSFWAKLHSKSATPSYASYVNTTDSMEALRDNVGTAGAGLTAVVWNAAWDAEVQSEVEDGLNNLGYTTTVSGRIDAAISTRFAAASAPSNFSSLGINASGHISRVVLVDTLTTYTGNTVQSGDAFARIGANGAGLSAIPWNASWDAEVESEVTDGLTAFGAATASALATVSTNVSTVLSRLGSITGSGINTVLGFFRALAAKAAALTPTDLSSSTTFDNTTDSLEAVRDRGDAAWTTGSGAAAVEFRGFVAKSGATYHVSFCVMVGGQMIAGADLSSLAVTFYDEDGTNLTFSGSPTAHATGIVYASGTLGTAITDNKPVIVKIAATYAATAYSSVLPGANLA